MKVKKSILSIGLDNVLYPGLTYHPSTPGTPSGQNLNEALLALLSVFVQDGVQDDRQITINNKKLLSLEMMNLIYRGICY